MKRRGRKQKTKYFRYGILVFLLFALLNYVKANYDFGGVNLDAPKVEINETLVFQNDNVVEKLDINKAKLEDLEAKGLRKVVAKKIIRTRDFVGHIYNLNILETGLKEEEKSIIRDNFDVISNGNAIRHNINDLEKRELLIIGFNKKEVDYILKLKEKGYIQSDVDLKDKVNSEILEKYIYFE